MSETPDKQKPCHPVAVFREKHRLSMTELAKRIDWHMQGIDRMEKQGTIPRADRIRDIYMFSRLSGMTITPNDLYPVAQWDREFAAWCQARDVEHADD